MCLLTASRFRSGLLISGVGVFFLPSIFFLMIFAFSLSSLSFALSLSGSVDSPDFLLMFNSLFSENV